MKTARHLLAIILVAITLASPASAEHKSIPESDFNAYKELAQVKLDAAKESLQKDVAALGTRVDNQDKRIDQQGNRIGDVSISLTWFGILLTLLAIIAGFVGYYTASTKARKEAQDEARKAVDDWLKTHEADLKQRIKAAEDFAAESRAHIQTFEDEINQLKAQLSDKLITHTNNKMAETTALVEDAKRQIQATIAQSTDQTTPPASPAALEALQAQAENLLHKAEAEYTFNDWDNRAFAAFGEDKFDDAARYWQHVSEAPDTPPDIVARALSNRGVALAERGHADEAIAAYDRVEAHYANDTAPALRAQVAIALFNKGNALGKRGRTDEAIATYDLVDARYANDTAPALRELVAKALFNKGVGLGRLGHNNEAIAAYELVDARYATDTAPALREQAAKALVNKGVALGRLGHTDEAIATYELVEARYTNDTAPALREALATAQINKGNALEQRGRTDEAIAAYELVEARYANDETPALRKQVAYAQTGKGFTLLYRAKAHWATLDRRHADLDLAARLFEQAEAEADVDDKPIVLGNRAYCAHLRGEPVEVVHPLLERALKEGREQLYQATLDDLAIHPVPEDAAYRVLLDEVWAELRGEDPPAAAPGAG